ncbi:hypothetical protein SAMN05421810_10313 [Amycolatopsis arida]|uniref:Uncharacterized protein n=1 Tax=Amycolatopsis arida TaxID=587909 RepID=A0A1I5S590_9PSEU|nr:hypothetical protein [Amycolatopsis arida]TDX85286.1 hypothetical protein CLV69_11613 [Amycolatopsis arida]SFP65889.1 hypothetical protein SAMN05421810_10313 [Amycolatopsis arida]
MAEMYDGPTGDGLAVPLRLHNLLLALAGRIDDSALSEARELVATAHLDQAAELVAGTLIAGRIPVSAAEQREVALVLEMSRSDATLADHLVVDDGVLADKGPEHRFSADDEPERGLIEALDRTLHVLPDVRSVHAVWRNTPAGSVPGPLPQRVVLVDIGPEAHPPAVAYRVGKALRKAGLPSVVEVSGPWAERSGYYDSAYATANPVWFAPDAAGASIDTSDERRGRSTKGKNRHAARVSPEPEATQPRITQPQPVEPVESRSVEPQPEARPTAAPPADPAPAEPVEPPTAGSPVETVDEHEERRSTASTTEMSSAEVAQLRAALAEDDEKGRAIASAKLRPGQVVEIPELDLDDPALSERDRQLLRELHAELAEREKAEAAGGRVNGVNGVNGAARGMEPPKRGWTDGFSGA